MQSSAKRVPNVEMSAEYYRQRSTNGGLLISESTSISEQGTAYYRTPGIYRPGKASLRQCTAKRRSFSCSCGMWVGCRTPGTSRTAGCRSRSVRFPCRAVCVCRTAPRLRTKFFRELRAEDEIPEILEEYRVATRNAFLAGFDGVEIEAANGYLTK